LQGRKALLVLGSACTYAWRVAIAKGYGSGKGFAEFFFRLLCNSEGSVMMGWERGALIWPTPRTEALLPVAGMVDAPISRTLYCAALQPLSMSMHSIEMTLWCLGLRPRSSSSWAARRCWRAQSSPSAASRVT
jgi:hypothetical protein